MKARQFEDLTMTLNFTRFRNEGITEKNPFNLQASTFAKLGNILLFGCLGKYDDLEQL